MVGSDGATLLVGPSLASFEVEELGSFFEATKGQVMDAKRRRRAAKEQKVAEGAGRKEGEEREGAEVRDEGRRRGGRVMAGGQTEEAGRREQGGVASGEEVGEERGWEERIRTEYEAMQKDFW